MKTVLLKIDWSTVLTWQELWAWSEVWALFIPLTVLIAKRKRINNVFKPVIYYVFIALVLNSIADFSWRFQLRLDLPQWMRNNSSIYHLHAIIRLLLFTWFFRRLNEPFLVNVKKITPVLFLLFVFIHFIIIKPINSFLIDYNSELHATEAAILLFYCLQHYIFLSQQEYSASNIRSRSIGLFIAGLTIYVAINFFIFLFYSALMSISRKFSKQIWEVHNISYIILCCFIAWAFYESARSKH